VDVKDIPDVLKRIVGTKKEELRSMADIASLKKMAGDTPPPLDFAGAFAKGRHSVIAEIKQSSPSAGLISWNFDPVAAAKAYASGGADAVSILTDLQYFKGSPSFIRLCRPFLPGIPILRKDFIIAPEQIYEARALGADSFLLIAAILEKEQIVEFLETGRQLGMEALLESHTEEELEKSIASGARILGINSRNLHDFSVDLAIAETLVRRIPERCARISESGIHSPADSHRMFKAGFDAVLVGEYLMRGGPEKAGDMIRKIKEAPK